MDTFFDEVLGELLHAFIVAPTGTGKSKLAMGLMQHLSFQWDQPCVILADQGGGTAQEFLRYVTMADLASRTIYFDPNETEHFLGFNPLRKIETMPLSLQAKFVSEAILTALNIQDMDSTFFMPEMQKALYFLVYVLIEGGWTFHEAQWLLGNEPTTQGAAILQACSEPAVYGYWRSLQEMNLQQRKQLLSLLQSRLMPFLTSEVLGNVMSQRDHVLNMQELIETGQLLIADLSSYSTLTTFDSEVLGNLLVAEVVKACFARPPYTGKHVYLFIEECAEGLLSAEVGRILRRARKQHLHIILINTDITSIREANPVIFHQIWNNCSHKICFGDLAPEDLDIVAEEFFLDQMDPHAIKDQIDRTFFEPVESTRTIEGYSSTTSEHSSLSSGQSTTDGSSLAFVMDADNQMFPMITGDALREIESQSSNDGYSSSSSQGESHSESHSEVTVPFYEFKERQELSNRTFYQLDELLHLAKQRLKTLPQRHICLKRRGQPAQILEVPYIEDLPELDDYHDETRVEIFKQSGCYATVEEITAEHNRRDQALSGLSAATITIEQRK